MKKILLSLFFSVFVLIVYSQTSIPRTIDLLCVNSALESGKVIVYNSMFGSIDNYSVRKNGMTSIMLEQGASYVVCFNGKMYYPNGDECTVPYAYATYLGDNTWVNTADFVALKKAGIDFRQYLVMWPKTQ